MFTKTGGKWSVCVCIRQTQPSLNIFCPWRCNEERGKSLQFYPFNIISFLPLSLYTYHKHISLPLVCLGLWLPKVECVAVEPKKLLWVFKARGSVLIWDRLAKFKVIFVHLRKTLPYKLSICFRFAVSLCFLASLRRRWHYNVVICCFGTDPFYPGVTSTPSKSRDVPMQKTPVVLQNSRYFDYIIHQSLMYMYPNSEKLVFDTLH